MTIVNQGHELCACPVRFTLLLLLLQLMREHDVWLSIQPLLDDADGFSFDDPGSQKN